MRYRIIKGKVKSGHLNFLTGSFFIDNQKVNANNLVRMLTLRKSRWAKVKVVDGDKTIVAIIDAR